MAKLTKAQRDNAVDEVMPWVRGLVCSLTNDPDTADECMSAALVKLAKLLDRYDTDSGAKFRTYAHEGIRGVISDTAKREAVIMRRCMPMGSCEDDIGADGIADSVTTKVALDETLAGLPECDQAAIRGYSEGADYEELRVIFLRHGVCIGRQSASRRVLRCAQKAGRATPWSEG
jgi:DNA-directed RNA polymerase specialized sigma24 family protein